jgi:hypothetical protein
VAETQGVGSCAKRPPERGAAKAVWPPSPPARAEVRAMLPSESSVGAPAELRTGGPDGDSDGRPDHHQRSVGASMLLLGPRGKPLLPKQEKRRPSSKRKGTSRSDDGGGMMGHAVCHHLPALASMADP